MKLAGCTLVPLVIVTFASYARCELLTFGVIGGLGGLGYYAYERYKCMYQECCTDDYIHPDLDSE